MTVSPPGATRSPGVARGGAPQGEETIARLAQVACRIFRERGYHATSMRVIASAMGMQPAALYYYYPSKERLLYSIMDTAIDALTQRVVAGIDPTAPAPAQLTQAITAHITTTADHLDELSVFLHEMKSLSPDLQESLGIKRNRYEHIFRDILRRGTESGDLTHVDPRLAGFMILAACNWLYNWYRPGGAYRPEEIASAFSDMLLHGLVPRG